MTLGVYKLLFLMHEKSEDKKSSLDNVTEIKLQSVTQSSRAL